MTVRLTGKKALITGAGAGLGREIAREFARRGADVALHYNASAAGAEQVLAEVKEMNINAALIKADLRDAGEAAALPDRAAEALRGLDILVNNAGLTNSLRFLETGINEYNDMFDLNMRGMFFCSQSAVKYMAGGGVIINMSSVHGTHSLPGYTAYAATKGAIIAFSRQLSIELAKKNIRVNCIAPGCIIVDKDFERRPDLDVAELGHGIPLGKTGEPIDAARLAAFLASDEANYITGAVIPIDGGLLAKLAFSTPNAVE